MTNTVFYEFVTTDTVSADSPLAAPADVKFPFNTNTVAIMETDRGVRFAARPEQLVDLAMTVRPQMTLENYTAQHNGIKGGTVTDTDDCINEALNAIFMRDTISSPLDSIPSDMASDRLAAWSDTITKIEDSGLPRPPKPPPA